MLVADREARSVCASWLPNPNLTIRMQTTSLRGRHGVEPGTVEQAGVGLAAIGMDAAIVLHDLLPSRLALGERGGIRERRAIELVRIEVGDDLVAILDEGDR